MKPFFVLSFILQRFYQILCINAETLGVGMQVIGEISHIVGDHLQSVNHGDAKLMRRIGNGGVHLANVPKGELNRIKITAPNGSDDVDLRFGEETEHLFNVFFATQINGIKRMKSACIVRAEGNEYGVGFKFAAVEGGGLKEGAANT